MRRFQGNARAGSDRLPLPAQAYHRGGAAGDLFCQRPLPEAAWRECRRQRTVGRRWYDKGSP